MWVKQCHKPPIWEWFIPPIYGEIGGGYYCSTNINLKPTKVLASLVSRWVLGLLTNNPNNFIQYIYILDNICELAVQLPMSK